MIKNISEKILDEVMKQTAKGGTGFVSTKTIANKLHISEPTIFLHFKTKQDLMNATFQLAWERFSAVSLNPLLMDKTKKVSFDEFKPFIMLKMEDEKEIFYMHHYRASNYYQKDFVDGVRASYFASLDKVIAELFGELNPFDVRIIEHGFLDTEIAYMTTAIRERVTDDRTLRVMFQSLVGFFFAPLNYLAAQKAAGKED